MLIKDNTQIVYTSENISTNAIQFKWSVDGDKQEKESVGNSLDQSEVTYSKGQNSTSSGGDGRIGGFSLKGQLDGANISNSQSYISGEIGWNQKYIKTNKVKQILLPIMHLVRQSRARGINEALVWEVLLEHRWDIDQLKGSICLNEPEMADVIFKTAMDLNLEYDWNTWITGEDVSLGMELYAAIYYCSDHLKEAKYLSLLYNHILTEQTLKTVVATTFHNIQPNGGGWIKDFSAVNMWYKRLEARYNFSLGPSILGLLTSDKLAELVSLHPPYLDEHKIEQKIDNISSLLGKLNHTIPSYLTC